MTEHPTRVVLSLIRAASAFVTVVGLAAIAVAQGQFTVQLPQPTGTYAIGTAYFDLVDEARAEGFAETGQHRRELLVRCWYPAERPAAGAKPEPFWGRDTKETAGRLAGYLGQRPGAVPEGALNSLELVQSHAYADAPLAKSPSPYPVLVFSHGYIPGFLAQNTAQMEELASHGYVVFSIGHTYESIVSIFPDGRIVPFSQARLVGFGGELAKTRDLNAKYMAATDPTEKDAVLRKLLAESPVLRDSQRVWTADTRFVLDQLERMNTGKLKSIFHKKLDLKRIGVFGMSFGGGIAGQVCAVDDRCKAGINMDGMQYGNLDRPLSRPFMFMQSEAGTGLNRLFYERAAGGAYLLSVKGSTHFNLTDFSLLSPDFKKSGLLGPIDGGRLEKIMSDYILAFFDRYLKGKDSPLLKGTTSSYPEVELKSKAATGPLPVGTQH